MNKRLHVVSLPHTQTTRQYLTCAYTQKVIKFCKMMRQQGYYVILYSNDQNEAECDEHVVLLTEEERASWFGDGFDTVLTPLQWNPAEPYWALANTRAIVEIGARKEEHDFLCIIGGNCQQPISNAHPNLLTVEWGVGYEGIYNDFCAFESYAWMHWVYGKRNIVNGRAYDTVIPNFFDVADFHVAPRTELPKSYEDIPGSGRVRVTSRGLRTPRKDDYLLFLGRVIQRKGLETAGLVAQRAGRKLIVAGPGAAWSEDHSALLTPEGIRVEGDVEYVGEVGVEERADLLSRAAALIIPTQYIEPFGGVAIEAMLSGTPVVASDWGSFTEIVTPDVGGRFSTLQEGVRTVETVMALDPDKIRAYALARYSLGAVGPRFDSWFRRLDTLWGGGWYA